LKLINSIYTLGFFIPLRLNNLWFTEEGVGHIWSSKKGNMMFDARWWSDNVSYVWENIYCIIMSQSTLFFYSFLLSFCSFLL